MKPIFALLIFLTGNTYMDKTINPNLVVEYNNYEKRVELKWQNTVPGIDKFVLQRSTDNLSWIDLHTSTPEDIRKKKILKFNDYYFGKENNYYRLKIYSKEELDFSPSILIKIGSNWDNWKIYPVPVQDIINLQYNGSEPIRNAVGVFIRNSYGYVFTRKRFSSINRHLQIPVDNLGRGTYEIYIVINDKMIWSQRFVK